MLSAAILGGDRRVKRAGDKEGGDRVAQPIWPFRTVRFLPVCTVRQGLPARGKTDTFLLTQIMTLQ